MLLIPIKYEPGRSYVTYSVLLYELPKFLSSPLQTFNGQETLTTFP